MDVRPWFFLVLVLLPLSGCWQVKTAEQTLQKFVEAANARDFATAEALLTPRLLRGIPPGALDRSWASAEHSTLTRIQEVGNTAVYRVDSVLTPEAVVPTFGFQFTAEELQTFLTEPDREDPRFRPLRSQLAFYDPLEDGRVRSAMDITLYRQAEGWRVELARLRPLNQTVLEDPVQLAEEGQPFTLTGTVRLLNRNEEWIGVDLEEVSPSLERYADSLVSVVPAEDAVVTRGGEPIRWAELRPGETVEMAGNVRFAIVADAEGRIPAAITAERITVITDGDSR
ncbi:hypothetical protein L1047_10630 [Synechococcus sp. Nb3U1]|uniref:hypothetical protein n=1 Tax=Synechococcus sp. Nb3U1 TaxID=1914529 RepID=UPI001F41F00D|nr:hypothetical protein [Synechococcus sp. Nb3U1]MCF2971648.1 hypothetical protein [Synechococcus sp. Nb3U1]